MKSKFYRGASAAMLTLFRGDGAIDTPAMARYANALLAEGLSGVLLFGTTGEGPSLSVGERVQAIREIIAAGVPADRCIVGVASAAFEDVVELTRVTGELKCGGALVLPPFYFRQASDDGVRSFLAALIERTSNAATKLFLYHFPEMSGVTYSTETIAFVMRQYPDRIVGIKDSSGVAANTLDWIDRFPELEIYTGDDDQIRNVIRRGGAGSMTATAGIAPSLVAGVMNAVVAAPGGEASQEELLNRFWVDVLLAGKVTEGMKALFRSKIGAPDWQTCRLPLKPISEREASELADTLATIDTGVIAAEIRRLGAAVSLGATNRLAGGSA